MNEQECDNSAVHLAHCYQGEYPVCKYGDENCPAISKVKAQQEQEPVGRFAKFTDGVWRPVTEYSAGVPLYTHPPQRTWQGLMDDERLQVINANASTGLWLMAKDIEAKLKQKNGFADSD